MEESNPVPEQVSNDQSVMNYVSGKERDVSSTKSMPDATIYANNRFAPTIIHALSTETIIHQTVTPV